MRSAEALPCYPLLLSSRRTGRILTSMLLAGRAEADLGPFLGGGAQIPGVAGQEDRDAVVVLGQRGGIAGAEAVEFGAVAVEPARRLVGRAVEPCRETVFGLQSRLQYVELQVTDHPDDAAAAAVDRLEQAGDA